MCSHPRTGEATDEKIAEKNRQKFNELNLSRQNHGLRQRVATRAGKGWAMKRAVRSSSDV